MLQTLVISKNKPLNNNSLCQPESFWNLVWENDPTHDFILNGLYKSRKKQVASDSEQIGFEQKRKLPLKGNWVSTNTESAQQCHRYGMLFIKLNSVMSDKLFTDA